MNTVRKLTIATFTLALALTACAKGAGPLPGDSVDSDGGITLSPPSPQIGPHDSKPADPPGAIESRLYPPELIMENQAALGIDPTQRDLLLAEIERAQTELLHLQWDLQGEKEKLVKVLDSDVVDEKAAMDAANHVMERENAVKAAHLKMLVHLKNMLTPPQQAKLRSLRSGKAEARDGGGPTR